MNFLINKRYPKKYFVCFIIVMIGLYFLAGNWINVNHDVDYFMTDKNVTKEWDKNVEKYNRSQVCLILLWTKFFSYADFSFVLGQQPFVNQKCPVYNCFVSQDRALINQSDAVIFRIRDVVLSDLPDPKLRRSNQYWIFYLLESPVYTNLDLKAFNGFFNWTMTYRLDSDIVNTYGTTRLSNGSQVNETKGRNASRKLVAWLVSHCQTNSQRERYVAELRNYVPVDQFGDCNSRQCNAECEKSVFENYKFYLSFENSLCTDYVTEKFFKVLKHNVIPVVYGLGNYSSLGPPRSYIDVRHFQSPKHLAWYLMALDANKTAYDEYLEWKSGYEVLSDIPGPGFCELCRRLQQRNPPKIYNDIHRWWHNGGENSDKPLCRSSQLV